MQPTDYKPVDCGLHSEYELLIMRGCKCRLAWCDAMGGVHVQAVTPTDLRTRNREEFMAVSDTAGMEHEVRLDRILHCAPAA